jgi:hypothetical protein
MRRRLLALALLLALCPTPARAQPFASEVLTVSTSPIGITDSLCRVGPTVTGAVIEVVSGTINYLLHDASATPGATSHKLEAGGVLTLRAPLKWRAIRNGGSDATVRVTCSDNVAESIVKVGAAGQVGSNVSVTDGVDTAQVTATGGGSLQVECLAGCGAADGVIRDGTGDTTQANVSSGRLHVDGSGVTQPVSGTVTANAGSGTFFDGIVRDGAGDTTQANVSSGRLHTDGSGVTQPVSGTVTANAGSGTFFDGVVRDGAGDTTQANVSSGRLHVDGSGVTQPVSGTVTVGTFPDNEPFNLAQVGGGTVTTVATGNAIPSATSQPATNARGLNTRPVHDDPCATKLTTPLPISVTANTQLVAAVGGQHVYVCHINLVVGAATNVGIVAGTGSTCATSTAGVFGGATAATGWNMAANGGIVVGDGGRTVGRTETAGDALCIFVSAANQTSGSIMYVQQ